MLRVIAFLVVCLTFATFTAAAQAAEARIAVAGNFASPMKAIVAAFEQHSGHRVLPSFGSTGKLYAQVKNGAPFDALLAADQRRPRMLEEEGMAVAGSRFTYAIGSLVLWSAEPDAISDGPQLLKQGGFERLAIANPRLAPYGQAAVQTISSLDLTEALEPKLVMGENIAQAFQFVATGNAQLGFVALSQVIDDGEIAKGSGWIVPAGLHDAIRQDAVVLERGRDNPVVTELFAFLKGGEARDLIAAFGYATE
jgi:molybdate transport system substrate-binding protein